MSYTTVLKKQRCAGNQNVWWNSMQLSVRSCRSPYKRNPITASYSIHGHTLEVVSSAKYLGVYLDTHLNFNAHIDAITRKANSIRGFLGRNLGHCTRKLKEAAYHLRQTLCWVCILYLGPSHPAQYPQVGKGPAQLCTLRHWWFWATEQCFCNAERSQLANFGGTTLPESPLHDVQNPSKSSGHQGRSVPQSIIVYHKRSQLPIQDSQTKSSVYTMSYFPRTIRAWNNLQKDPVVYSSLDTFKAVLRDPLLM